jgi:hypothetical protein
VLTGETHPILSGSGLVKDEDRVMAALAHPEARHQDSTGCLPDHNPILLYQIRL